MSQRLFLRLAADGSLSWLREGASPRGAGATAGAPPASTLAQAGEVIVLVPGSEVLLTRARLAARSRAQLLKALPFAIEEGLLAPVESLHFVATAPRDDEVGVAVVARTTLDGWLAQLAAAGVQADALVPETLGLPCVEGRATLLLEDGLVSARLGPWSAFSCTPAELPGWLAQLSPQEQWEVHDFRASPRAPLPLPLPVQVQHDPERDATAFLAVHAGQRTLNLLDGAYAGQRRRRNDGALWWRVAAVLAAAVVALALLARGAQVWQLARESARLQAAAHAAVLKAVPDLDPKVLERLTPEQVLGARLGAARDAQPGGLRALLRAVGPIVADGSSRIQLRGLDYRNGVLELALRGADLNAVDLVRERVAMLPGFKAELTAVSSGADGVDGRLRVDAAQARKAGP